MTKQTDLHTKYTKEIIPALSKSLGVKNVMAIPRITKITISVGMGTYLKIHAKDHGTVVDNLKSISGQSPILTKARKAISNFKIRQGEIVGATVTLRGKRMYDFLTKLVNVVFPRVKDFRGISKKAFDGKGNYTLGLKDQFVFPEISPDDITKYHGLQINIATTAKTNEHGMLLLQEFGFPFKK